MIGICIREKCVQDTLTGEQREIGSLFLGNRSRCTDRPQLHHGVLCCPTLKLCLQYDVLVEVIMIKYKKNIAVLRTNIDCIASLLCDVCDGTKGTRRKHDLMVVN